jgi:hypothetical protein
VAGSLISYVSDPITEVQLLSKGTALAGAHSTCPNRVGAQNTTLDASAFTPTRFLYCIHCS